MRVLITGDKSVSNTGFSTYKRKLLEELYKDKDFEVAEFAFSGTLEEKGLVPWKYYPCLPSKEDSDNDSYNKSPQLNKNGHYRWERALLHFKPDIVLTIQDPWQVDFQVSSMLKPFYRFVCGAPVDSHPQKVDYINIYHSADAVVPYTDYAKHVLENQGIQCLDSIPMGIDSDVFYPLDKERAKGQLGIPKDSIIFGFVARNQPRKRLPELCIAFKSYLDDPRVSQEDKDKSYLYLHTSYLDVHPWDIPRILLENRIQNKVLFSYFCMKTKSLYATPFKESTAYSPYSGEMSGTPIKPSTSPSFQWLNIVYNSMDLYVQMATNEGFGSPLIEAAATNTKVVAVNYSAMSEVTSKFGGDLIDPPATMEDPGVQARRAVMPVKELAEYMVSFVKDKKYQEPVTSRDLVLENFRWEDSIGEWKRVLKSAMDIKVKNWGDPPREIVLEPVEGKVTPSEFLEKLNSPLENRYSYRMLKDLKSLMQGGVSTGASWQPINQHGILEKYNNMYKIMSQLEQARQEGVEEELWQK